MDFLWILLIFGPMVCFVIGWIKDSFALKVGSVIVFVIVFIVAMSLPKTPEAAADEEYDDVMKSYDWGDDYYYDSSDNEVKKKPW